MVLSQLQLGEQHVEDFHGYSLRSHGGHWGGIPDFNKGVDIRLGDVVVSQPDGTHGGVMQYDFQKNLGNGMFECKGVL